MKPLLGWSLTLFSFDQLPWFNPLKKWLWCWKNRFLLCTRGHRRGTQSQGWLTTQPSSRTQLSQVYFRLVLVPLRRVIQDVESYIRFPPMLNKRYSGEMIAFFAAKAKASTIAALEDHLPPSPSWAGCVRETSRVCNDLYPLHAAYVLCVGNFIFVVLSRLVSSGTSS